MGQFLTGNSKQDPPYTAVMSAFNRYQGVQLSATTHPVDGDARVMRRLVKPSGPQYRNRKGLITLLAKVGFGLWFIPSMEPDGIFGVSAHHRLVARPLHMVTNTREVLDRRQARAAMREQQKRMAQAKLRFDALKAVSLQRANQAIIDALAKDVFDTWREVTAIRTTNFDSGTFFIGEGGQPMPTQVPEGGYIVQFRPVWFPHKGSRVYGLTIPMIFSIAADGPPSLVGHSGHPHAYLTADASRGEGGICAGVTGGRGYNGTPNDFHVNATASLMLLRNWWVGTDMSPATGNWRQLGRQWWTANGEAYLADERRRTYIKAPAEPDDAKSEATFFDLTPEKLAELAPPMVSFPCEVCAHPVISPDDDDRDRRAPCNYCAKKLCTNCAYAHIDGKGGCKVNPLLWQGSFKPLTAGQVYKCTFPSVWQYNLMPGNCPNTAGYVAVDPVADIRHAMSHVCHEHYMALPEEEPPNPMKVMPKGVTWHKGEYMKRLMGRCVFPGNDRARIYVPDNINICANAGEYQTQPWITDTNEPARLCKMHYDLLPEPPEGWTKPKATYDYTPHGRYHCEVSGCDPVGLTGRRMRNDAVWTLRNYGAQTDTRIVYLICDRHARELEAEGIAELHGGPLPMPIAAEGPVVTPAEEVPVYTHEEPRYTCEWPDHGAYITNITCNAPVAWRHPDGFNGPPNLPHYLCEGHAQALRMDGHIHLEGEAPPVVAPEAFHFINLAPHYGFSCEYPDHGNTRAWHRTTAQWAVEGHNAPTTLRRYTNTQLGDLPRYLCDDHAAVLEAEGRITLTEVPTPQVV